MASSRGGGGGRQRWCGAPLTPLMEGPDLDVQHHYYNSGKKESSWDMIREWFRPQKTFPVGAGAATNTTTASTSSVLYGNSCSQDLKLLLGVLGCPLAPIPLVNNPTYHLHLRDIPIEKSAAYYIIQQYLAATGCLKKKEEGVHSKMKTNMYAAGSVKMVCCPTEVSSGKGVRTLGTRTVENGCFELWQMSPGMWSLELVVGGGGSTSGNKVLAGSNGKIVWRHTPWLGTHAAKGPQRPLRRIIQGLDPRSTARLFAKAKCLGEKRIGGEDCFVLKVAADGAAVMKRNEGVAAQVIRHVLYGYFSQKTGLLVYLEDSHLTRVALAVQEDLEGEEEEEETSSSVYWETTIGSSISDYREVDGLLVAHQGRSVATVFRFGETSSEHCRTRMEEVWHIHDVVYDVPGLSFHSFIPPADIFH